MNLQEQVNADMVVAMKTKKTAQLSFLRVISGELSTNAKKKEKEKLDEQKILCTMANNAKEMGNDTEVRILNKYIVKVEMFTEDQLRTIIAEIVGLNDYSTMKDMGKVMAALKSNPASNQIDMKLANGIVREILNQ